MRPKFVMINDSNKLRYLLLLTLKIFIENKFYKNNFFYYNILQVFKFYYEKIHFMSR